MNLLTDQEFDSEYSQTQRVQLGLKLLNFKEGAKNPISFRYVDCPGQYLHYMKASMYAFQKPDIILILMDGSLKLEEQQIRNWVFTTMQQVYQHHRYRSNAPQLMEINNQDEQQIENTPNLKGGRRRSSAKSVNRMSNNTGQFNPMNGGGSAVNPNNNDANHKSSVVNDNNEQSLRGMSNIDQSHSPLTKQAAFVDDQPGFMPEIVHVFTKRDLIGYDGYQKQLKVIEELQHEGIIDQFFFVSSLSKYGINDLKKYLIEFQLQTQYVEQSFK